MYTGGGTSRDSLPLYRKENVGFAPLPPTSKPDDCDGRIVPLNTCESAVAERLSFAGGSGASIRSGQRVL